MSEVFCEVEGLGGVGRLQSISTRERLGVPSTATVDLLCDPALDADALLGKACRIDVSTAHGGRALVGIVMGITVSAGSDPTALRRVRLDVRSALARLELRRRSRVLQKLAIPEIVRRTLVDGGYGSDAVVLRLAGEHATREYVVQYDETDAAFVRRLCEDEGLYLRFEEREGRGVALLEDTSSAAEVAAEALAVVDESGLGHARPVAFAARAQARLRPGTATLRDYHCETPALDLASTATGGGEAEREVEIYEAPGGFCDERAGARRARLRLEALRCDAESVRFETTAGGLAPGHVVRLERAPDAAAPDELEGEVFVVEVAQRWAAGGEGHRVEVEAIPREVPFRLARVTPRPRILGVQTAVVTGAPGREIDVDELGRARLRFPWDREGPDAGPSSLPVRVVQPNMPGSMLLPRVGWEVVVGFDEGDPERPYVLGRVDNGSHPPPYALPKNKTVTALATLSSPGGARQNVLRFDDAAGRQSFAVEAATGKTITVGGDMFVQTAKNENLVVKGSQSRAVGGSETISVAQGYVDESASQSLSIGGSHHAFVKGRASVDTGSESVVVGGACLEKVGNPVDGAANLAKAAAMAGVAAVGQAGGVALGKGVGKALGAGAGKLVGAAGAAAAGLAPGVIEAGAKKGEKAAKQAALSGAIGQVAGAIPGGPELLGAIGRVVPMPWDEPKGGPDAAGGGAAGASESAGAEGPSSGKRNTIVAGPMMEIVGGPVGVVSPGSVGSTTLGPSMLLVAGSSSARGASYGVRTLGPATETVGSLGIRVGQHVARTIKGSLATTIAGALESSAGGDHSIKANGSVDLTVGGALTLGGGTVVLSCGGSTISISGSGVLVKASTITVTGTTTQSGATGHA